MKWKVFDIVGPVMVGPSSSHTSGAVKLGLFANRLIGGIPDEAKIYLHGSYAEVYAGHGTDISLVAGLLGFEPDSEKVVKAFEEANKHNMKYEIIPTDLGENYHPNTAKFILEKNGEIIELVGESIGAGKIQIVEINGMKTDSLSGDLDTLLILDIDIPGVIAEVTRKIAKDNINIATMNISRDKKGGKEMMIVTLDNPISNDTVKEIENLETVIWARKMPILT